MATLACPWQAAQSHFSPDERRRQWFSELRGLGAETSWEGSRPKYELVPYDERAAAAA
jgi:hypothetical protein